MAASSMARTNRVEAADLVRCSAQCALDIPLRSIAMIATGLATARFLKAFQDRMGFTMSPTSFRSASSMRMDEQWTGITMGAR